MQISAVALQEELGVAGDHSQRLLQIVTGGKCELVQILVGAEKFLVAPAKTLFYCLDLIDIQVDSGPPKDRAAIVPYRHAPGQHPMIAAVHAQKAVLRIPGA